MRKFSQVAWIVVVLGLAPFMEQAEARPGAWDFDDSVLSAPVTRVIHEEVALYADKKTPTGENLACKNTLPKHLKLHFSSEDNFVRRAEVASSSREKLELLDHQEDCLVTALNNLEIPVGKNEARALLNQVKAVKITFGIKID